MRIRTLESNRGPNNLDRRHQWRLLALVLGLGLVVILVGYMRNPNAVRRIERVFPTQRPVSGDHVERQLARRTTEPAADVFRAPGPDRSRDEATSFLPDFQPQLLESIRDNTHFRSEESAAWFHFFEQLRSSNAADIRKASRGPVGYVQLVDQPHVYRGTVVTIRGTVRRVETLDAPTNDIGLERYHLLTIRPAGRQIWPIRAYVLELPATFPRGDDASAEVAISGMFFKNWSYAWEGGVGLAPVVLARNVQWLDEMSAATALPTTGPSVAHTIVGALLLTTALMAWIVWNTRRAAYHRSKKDENAG